MLFCTVFILGLGGLTESGAPDWLADKPQGSFHFHLSSARIIGVQMYSAIPVFFFKDFIFIYICICMSVYHICTVPMYRPEEGIGSSELGVTDGVNYLTWMLGI